jgi:hypothetical protein
MGQLCEGGVGVGRGFEKFGFVKYHLYAQIGTSEVFHTFLQV